MKTLAIFKDSFFTVLEFGIQELIELNENLSQMEEHFEEEMDIRFQNFAKGFINYLKNKEVLTEVSDEEIIDTLGIEETPKKPSKKLKSK